MPLIKITDKLIVDPHSVAAVIDHTPYPLIRLKNCDNNIAVDGKLSVAEIQSLVNKAIEEQARTASMESFGDRAARR